MLTINEHRFLRDLRRLADVGLLPDELAGGRDRRAFSLAEREARRLFADLAEDAGLKVSTDAAGNLSAQLVSATPDAPVLLFGSHMDTVPNGGPYDGALGVIAGLETLRVLQEREEGLPITLECIAFTDEEGRYCGLTGSQLFAGTYSRAATQRFHDATSRYPGDMEAMSEILPVEFTVENLLQAERKSDEVLAFVELHIEQGPQLERGHVAIGVVDAIFGRASCQVVFKGRSDHAGTTPMDMRADALEAAARFVVHMNDFVRSECTGAVLTCGKLDVQPGADNVVPREARVWVEYRANTTEMLDTIGRRLDRFVREINVADHTSATIGEEHRLEPQAMHPAIQKAVVDSCQALGYPAMTISSGALHDAHSLAAVLPAGMIFVPSIDGRSHCPEENTEPADLVAGANVLLQTIVRLMDSSNEWNHPRSS